MNLGYAFANVITKEAASNFVLVRSTVLPAALSQCFTVCRPRLNWKVTTVSVSEFKVKIVRIVALHRDLEERHGSARKSKFACDEAWNVDSARWRGVQFPCISALQCEVARGHIALVSIGLQTTVIQRVQTCLWGYGRHARLVLPLQRNSHPHCTCENAARYIHRYIHIRPEVVGWAPPV